MIENAWLAYSATRFQLTPTLSHRGGWQGEGDYPQDIEKILLSLFPNRRAGLNDMTLTKTDIVESVIDSVRFKRRRKSRQQFLFPEMDCIFLSRRRAGEIVNTVFETIKAALVRGEDVRISGFGRFRVIFKWARKGRNPQTGEMIILRSRRTVTFRSSPKLREKINK